MRVGYIFKRLVMALSAIVGVGLSSAPAQATTEVWTFMGACFDCTDTFEWTTATATLTLKDYTTGTELAAANYVSFDYSSLKYPSFSFGAIAALSGVLNEGTSNVAITRAAATPVNYFGTATNGSWSLIQQFPSDLGIAGTWTLASVIPDVPEPGAWLMMMLGFGMMGVTLRRPRQIPLLG